MYMKRAEGTLWRELFHIYIHDRRTTRKVFLLSCVSLMFLFFSSSWQNPSSKAHSSNCKLRYVLFYWTAYYGTVSRSFIFRAVGSCTGPFALGAFPSDLLHFCASSREKPWFFVHDEVSCVPFSRKHALLHSSLGLSRYCIALSHLEYI